MEAPLACPSVATAPAAGVAPPAPAVAASGAATTVAAAAAAAGGGGAAGGVADAAAVEAADDGSGATTGAEAGATDATPLPLLLPGLLVVLTKLLDFDRGAGSFPPRSTAITCSGVIPPLPLLLLLLPSMFTVLVARPNGAPQAGSQLRSAACL